MKILDYFVPSSNYKSFVCLPSLEHPRLIVPVYKRKLFKTAFNIHNTSSIKNKILRSAFCNLYPASLLLMKNRVRPTELLVSLINQIADILNTEKILYSGYIGTPGKRQKLTLQLFTSSTKLIGFLKIADSSYAKKALQTEYEALEYLHNKKFTSFFSPDTILYKKQDTHSYLLQKDIFCSSNYITLSDGGRVVNVLLELGKKSITNNGSKELLQDLYQFWEKQKNRVPNRCFNFVNKCVYNLLGKNIPSVAVHGDFVPYNLKRIGKIISIIDWEYFSESGLPLYDFFHFYFNGYLHIKKRTPGSIVDMLIYNNKIMNLFKKYLSELMIDDNLVKDIFILYLLSAWQVFYSHNKSHQNNPYLQAIKYISTI